MCDLLQRRLDPTSPLLPSPFFPPPTSPPTTTTVPLPVSNCPRGYQHGKREEPFSDKFNPLRKLNYDYYLEILKYEIIEKRRYIWVLTITSSTVALDAEVIFSPFFNNTNSYY
jgi:hypothetical protein